MILIKRRLKTVSSKVMARAITKGKRKIFLLSRGILQRCLIRVAERCRFKTVERIKVEGKK